MKKIAAMTAIVAWFPCRCWLPDRAGIPVLLRPRRQVQPPVAAASPARAARSPPSPMSNRCGTIQVTLRGKITERVSDDLYKFEDATGVINVDIDHKRWNGVTVGPQDTVEIQGSR